VADAHLEVYIHLVWATWDRQPFLIPSVRSGVYACIRSECTKLGAKVLAIGGIDDHIHLLVELPSTVSLAQLMKQIKGSSSHLATRTDTPAEVFKWQGGYAAFRVSKSALPSEIRYIEKQEEHHRDGTTHCTAEIAWEELPPHPADA
jgi:REP element-mobilizing transposase RayT